MLFVSPFIPSSPFGEPPRGRLDRLSLWLHAGWPPALNFPALNKIHLAFATFQRIWVATDQTCSLQSTLINFRRAGLRHSTQEETENREEQLFLHIVISFMAGCLLIPTWSLSCYIIPESIDWPCCVSVLSLNGQMTAFCLEAGWTVGKIMTQCQWDVLFSLLSWDHFITNTAMCDHMRNWWNYLEEGDENLL